MSGSPTAPSRALRVLLRLVLGRDALERALGDLEETGERVLRLRGESAARRVCVREALLILLWAAIDRVRRIGEARPGTEPTRRATMIGDFMQDVRQGGRSLLRRPGFALVVITVLGLGIGSNVAIFTLADRLFLRPPPLIEAPDELVRVFRYWGVPDAGGAVSYPDYLDYRDGSTTLAGLAAYASIPVAVTARIADGSATAQVLTITSDYFDVLGVEPSAGRFFRSDENRTPGAHPVAIVSWGFWQSTLGGAPDAVGRDVYLNGTAFTVLGVAPRGFRGLGPGDPVPDLYIPILMRDAITPSSDTAWRERLPDLRDRWLRVVGRLRPGATVEAAQEELALVAGRIRELENGEPNESVLVSPEYRWQPRTSAQLAGLTRVLLAAVGLLLMCATANVAILLVARATTRERELGIRTALGAGRGRVARLMLAESLLLGSAGCAVGIAVAVVAARMASALLPVKLDVPFAPDGRMLLAALATSLLTALVVGIAPALHATRTDVLGTIQGRDRRAGGGRLRDGLVVLQVALSLVLVAGAALFARSLAAARSVDTGFEPVGVLLVGMNLGNHGYDSERGIAFIREGLDRIGGLPSVEHVTVTRQVPFRGEWTSDLQPWPGSSFADGRAELTTGMNMVGPGYFDVMGIPVLRGRAIGSDDVQGRPIAMVVNETFARLAFSDGDALGRTVRAGARQGTIVGIARDAIYYDLTEERQPQLYISALQFFPSSVRFAVRTTDPLSLSAPVQRALHGIDPDVAFASVETLETVHAEQYARVRASAQVVGLTGIIALLLASAGLYGVMAYRVSQRTRELGLRMALGASRGSLARAVVIRGLRLALLGVALGTLATLALGRLVEAMLFGIEPRDPAALTAAPLILLVVAALAVIVPALRAMRIDPVRAMHVD